MPRSSTVSLIARQGDNIIISMSALKVLDTAAIIALIRGLVNASEQPMKKRAYTQKPILEDIAEKEDEIAEKE